jgi:hypothetical protein
MSSAKMLGSEQFTLGAMLFCHLKQSSDLHHVLGSLNQSFANLIGQHPRLKHWPAR